VVDDSPPSREGRGVPTIRELLADSRLRLALVAGADAVDREVGWAHVSELVDPTEFLEGGELLLLTGVSLSADPDEQAGYVARVAAAGVAGIGFGTGLSHAAVPPALVVAADRHGLPVLDVPRATPFLAITRAVARILARRDLAAREYVFAAQRALTAAAVGPAGVAAVLDEVARLSGGWGLLLSRAGVVLAAAPPAAAGHRASVAPDLVRLREAPGAASVVARHGPDETWVQSLLGGADLLGFLAVGRPTALTAAERQAVNAAVPLLTLALDRSGVVGRGTARLRASVLRLLLAGQVDVVEPVAGALWNGLPEPPVVMVICCGGRFALGAATDRLAADRRVAAACVVHGRLDDAVVAVAAPADLDTMLAAVRRIDGLRVGVSEPAGFDGLERAHREATKAAEIAGPGPGATVTAFRDVPRARLLELLPQAAAVTFSEALLAPLRGDASRTDLLGSLRVWLSHHGQWDPAAAELGVHRHTLRKRMLRVEKLLGRRLDSADLRAELWVALHVDRAGEPAAVRSR
jgi:purine catabolism regulator